VARLTWTFRAVRELEDIVERIAQDSPLNARKVAVRAASRAQLLLDQPRQGRRLPEYDGERELREIFVHRWRMIYEIIGDDIFIVALYHGARLISNTDPL
jgi:toxin ParE1/3/4